MKTYVIPALLLILSNAFMTFAWYGHLRFEKTALWVVILVSWGIAFLEYCFQVPANRIGHVAGTPAGQLKVMQECITLVVFVVFARFYLGEKLSWNYYVAFLFILGAVFMVFYFRNGDAAADRKQDAKRGFEVVVTQTTPQNVQLDSTGEEKAHG